MPGSLPPDDVRPVVLVLADISGYTKFLVSHDDKASRHSDMIIRELLETLLRQVDVPLEVSSVEGDALFLYAVRAGDETVWRRRSRNLVARFVEMFNQFGTRLAEIGAYSVCMCSACANVGNLELKIIVHVGEALFTQVGQYPTLSGVDVITVHRLAKNSIPEPRYVLMTSAAADALGTPDGVEVHHSTESYDVGDVDTVWFLPDLTGELDEEAIRSRFSDDNVAVQILRHEIVREYTDVALDPERGYHFNTGRAAAAVLGYHDDWLHGVPPGALESFAGTGNPFSAWPIEEGEYVVDVGSGSGTDAFIAASMVGHAGHVIGIDMTGPMLDKARAARETEGVDQLEFRDGHMEAMPVADGWADVVISNGVVNLSPVKSQVFAEMYRVLRPGGRLQIGDITVARPIPEGAKRNIDLWTN